MELKVPHFYSRPCGRGDAREAVLKLMTANFYSRPCGRGDQLFWRLQIVLHSISTHAPAGGATGDTARYRLDIPISTHAPAGGATALRSTTSGIVSIFLLTPLREGRRNCTALPWAFIPFLLTPLREGRLIRLNRGRCLGIISTHAPAGGATIGKADGSLTLSKFLLTPLREGRHLTIKPWMPLVNNFYSRPCGRGDSNFPQVRHEVLRQIAER